MGMGIDMDIGGGGAGMEEMMMAMMMGEMMSGGMGNPYGDEDMIMEEQMAREFSKMSK